MELLQRLPVPRRLGARAWLITLPSALLSFERRQKTPQLPIGKGRFAGVAIIAAGAALVAWAWRQPGAAIDVKGPLAPLARKPATLGGIMVLGGVSLLLRSLVLGLYSVGLIWAAGSGSVTIEDPKLESFMGRRED